MSSRGLKAQTTRRSGRLWSCAQAGSVAELQEVIGQLAELGVSVNSSPGKKGWRVTPLYIALQERNTAAVDVLLGEAADVDVNSRTDDG